MTHRKLPKATPPNLEELTSLRAFAAMIIIAFHMFHGDAHYGNAISVILEDGHLGVDLFFVLSGFIISHVYLKQIQSGNFSFGVFILNRFARVYPLHLFMIAIFVVAYSVGGRAGFVSAGEGQNWAHLPWHVTLLHAWGLTDGHSWNFPSWSVSAEIFAYFMFLPIATLVARIDGVRAVAFSVLMFWTASLLLSALGITLTKMMYDFGIVRVLFEFMLGVALYSTFEKSRVPLAIVRPMILLTLLAIGVLSYHQGNETIIVSFMGVLILLVAHLALDPRPTLLRHPILVYLGKISYATYLVHFLILIIATRIIDRIPDDEKLARLSAYVSVFLAIYLASAFLYHVIETPSRIAIRRLFSENPVISKKG